MDNKRRRFSAENEKGGKTEYEELQKLMGRTIKNQFYTDQMQEKEETITKEE